MKTRHMLYLAAALTASLAATTAFSAPRLANRGDALLPPSATQLKLTPAHAKQWDALRSEAAAMRQVGREDLRSGVTEFRTLLDQPAPDLRAFSNDAQRKFDAHLAEARALRERQLDLYESLTPDEQARVRKAMAERLDRFAQLRERLVSMFAAQS
jgi:Spy/CpxP family protein refolding chaperone